MHRSFYLSLSGLAVLLLLMSPARPSQAQDGAFTVDLLPVSIDALDLDTSASIEALVIARNQTAHRLRNLSLSWFADPDLRVNVTLKDSTQDTRPDELPPQGEYAWKVQVTPRDSVATAGTVYFRIDYEQLAEGKPAASRIHTAEWVVRSRGLKPIDALVDVRIETTLETLEEHRPGKAYLVLANKTDTLLQASLLRVEAPDFVSASYENTVRAIAPRQSIAYEVDLEADRRVTPGKHLLLFEIEIAQRQGQSVQRRQKLVSKEVEVGILGESAILTLLGVPAFFLLPGFLILVTAGFLWRVGLWKRESDTGAFALEADQAKLGDVTKPEFVVASITLSGLVTVGFLLSGRNYLASYGLEDLMWVWLFSVFGVGLVGYTLLMLGRNLYQDWRYPTEADTPIEVLKKLDRQHLGVHLRRVRVPVEGGEQEVFLLQDDPEHRSAIWVSPPLEIYWRDTAPLELRERVDKLLGPEDDAGELAKALKEGADAKAPGLELRWADSGKIKGLKRVETSTFSSPYLGAARFVNQHTVGGEG